MDLLGWAFEKKIRFLPTGKNKKTQSLVSGLIHRSLPFACRCLRISGLHQSFLCFFLKHRTSGCRLPAQSVFLSHHKSVLRRFFLCPFLWHHRSARHLFFLFVFLRHRNTFLHPPVPFVCLRHHTYVVQFQPV